MATGHTPTNLVVEIRPGEGGQDAETFAAELTSAFNAYARRHGCATDTEVGRTTLITISGPAGRLSLERFAGTHRIQRIPRNDRAGRRHTSTATVAVLERHPGQPDLHVDDSDVEIQTKRGSGKGGQHRNVTDSAVRALHRPTGIVVEINHGRSQHQNIAAAKTEIARRLASAAAMEADRHRNRTRTGQIASGERPIKSFTWNDQRAEVLDHATGRRYPMQPFLRGRLDLDS